MKKTFAALLAVLMLFSLAACGRDTTQTGADQGSFRGKIAIVTSAYDQTEEEYNSALYLIDKYGADVIVHYVWPYQFIDEIDQMIDIMAQIAADPDIKALVINQAVLGTSRAVDKLLETRRDIFIVYCDPAENMQEVTIRADLVLQPNHLIEGEAIVRQAKEQGAEVFIHYSFPRHMAMHLIAVRRESIMKACEELGILFVDAISPDPTSHVGLEAARQFILDDVPRIIELYGRNTAFYSTNCGMQLPLITAVIEHGGIYPAPCCPSPFHAFPEALGIETGYGFDDLEYVINESRRIIAEHGMTGRLSTWPVPSGALFTFIGVEYAMKWINEEVPEDGIDIEVITQINNDLIKRFAGADIMADLSLYERDGIIYDNIILLLLDYLNY